jgi:serine/threonine-protein kinase
VNVGYRHRPVACLDENTLAAMVSGALEGQRLAEAHEHLAGCSACSELVAMMVKGAREDQARLSFADTLPGARGSAPPGDEAPGVERIGRYIVLDVLGAGGMGTVHAAFDPVLERKVALKRVKSRASGASEEVKARLLREGKTIAQLNHPNIVSIFDMGVSNGEVFVAMELVEGGSLRAWLAARPRTWREVLAVYLDAGRGLACAHRAGLVHRDFKPENVLIGTDGRVRVSDFGLSTSVARDEWTPLPASAVARAEDKLTETGALLGTPAYMSPEQWEGLPADALSDQFSFCVALFEGLMGARPFERFAQRPTWARVEPSGGRGVPPAIRAALDRGLSIEPRQRFPSMDALLHVIEFLDGVAPPEAAPRSRAPWPSLVGGGLALAVGAAVLLSTRATAPGALATVDAGVPMVVDTARQADAGVPMVVDTARPADAGVPLVVDSARQADASDATVVGSTRPASAAKPLVKVKRPAAPAHPEKPAQPGGIISTYPGE